MQTINFYSYKGGVGRTLALCNIAMHLSKFNFKVCILDLDLEAPGIHLKFSSNISHPIKLGFVDYMHNHYFEDKRMKIEDIAIKLNLEQDYKGDICIIPAGSIANDTYINKFAKLNITNLIYQEDNNGLKFFLDFKDEINSIFTPDFLLIDSRTGITEISGIAATILADVNVYLTSNNVEGFEGISKISKNIEFNAEHFGLQKQKSVFVITRIPFADNKDKEDLIIERFKNYCPQYNPLVIHSDRRLEFEDDIVLKYNTKNKDEMVLVNDYIKLFSSIIDNDYIEPKLEEITKDTVANLLKDPDIVEQKITSLVNSYPHRITYEILIDLYKVRKVPISKILEVYDEYWEIGKDLSVNYLEYYIAIFIEDYNKRVGKNYDYNTDIIKYYIDHYKSNDTDIKLYLGLEYKYQNKFDKLKELYESIINKVESKENIIFELFDVYIYYNLKSEGDSLHKKYETIITADRKLFEQYMFFLLKTDQLDALNLLIEDDYFTADNLKIFLDKDYLKTYEFFKKFQYDLFNEYIYDVLADLQSYGETKEIIELGKILYKLGEFKEFKSAILEYKEYGSIVMEIERRNKRFIS